ncbi:MAG TPA: coenzyme F420-0:L-glutamate ligase [Bellilinea sp.]|nr:coenzyme F420-0:L-glutamate ligase [Bellilinea sp.]
MSKLTLTQLIGIPLIHPGDDLNGILNEALLENKIQLLDGDVLVIAQKIISKAENRLVNLSQITPSVEAHAISRKCGKRAELVELILQESKEIIRIRPGTIVVEHRLGFVCANAGIDHSNVVGPDGEPIDWVLMLPTDPDSSAGSISTYFKEKRDIDIGVLIVDSHGRAWRNGSIGMTIGLANVPAVIDMRGEKDIYGYTLKATQMAVADELAACATMMMGEADERIPAIHVRGFPHPLRKGDLSELIRKKEFDMFR